MCVCLVWCSTGGLGRSGSDGRCARVRDVAACIICMIRYGLHSILLGGMWFLRVLIRGVKTVLKHMGGCEEQQGCAGEVVAETRSVFATGGMIHSFSSLGHVIMVCSFHG
jgi:hypothetical protein